MEKKDVETIAKIFELLSKAKWDHVDGDFIINNFHLLVEFRKFEEKVKKIVNEVKPQIVEKPKRTRIKKEKKDDVKQ
jgi:uncharacterized membrane-anchored protein